SQRFIEQRLAGGTFGRLQRLLVKRQTQGGAGLTGEADYQRRQHPGAGGSHRARMVLASARSFAWRASANSLRKVSKAASRRAPRISPPLATKLAASSRASRTS